MTIGKYSQVNIYLIIIMIKLDTSSRISLFDAEKLCLKYFAGDGTSSVK